MTAVAMSLAPALIRMKAAAGTRAAVPGARQVLATLLQTTAPLGVAATSPRAIVPARVKVAGQPAIAPR